MKKNEEELAYWKGKAHGLQEALGKMKNKSQTIGSSFWHNFTANIAKYVAGIIVSALLVYGSVWYLGKKADETISEVKTEIKTAMPHPIDATKKWWNGDHWWNKKDENSTEKIKIKSIEKVEVVKEVTQEANKTSWTDKLKSLKFWGKDKNASKEQ